MKKFDLVWIICGTLTSVYSYYSYAKPTRLPITVSEANKSPMYFDKKEIEISGYLILRPDAHVLYENKKLHEEFRKKFNSRNGGFRVQDYSLYCLTIANPGFLMKYRKSLPRDSITVRGTFIAKYIGENDVDLGACPLPTGIMIDAQDLRRRYHLR